MNDSRSVNAGNDVDPSRSEPAKSSRPRRLFLISAVLLCVAAATLSNKTIGRAFADDERVNHNLFRLAIDVARIGMAALGVALLVTSSAIARRVALRRFAVLVCVVSAVGAGTGTYAYVRTKIPRPWEWSGLSMTDRLEQLAVAKAGFYGATPDELRAELPKGVTLEAGRARYQLGYSLMIRGRFEEAAEELKQALAVQRAVPTPADAARAAELRELENQTEKELSATYLRWGETDNCVHRHTCDSCIFPIQDGGVHQVPTGSQLALAVLKDLYEKDPADLTSKWLYNVAAMTLGEYPDKVPANLLAAPELFASEYPLPRFPDRAASSGLVDDRMAGGVILEDFDGDGDIDVVTSSMGLRDSLRYFRNEGDGTFHERTQEAGFEGLFGGLSISQGDFDNDGDADISVVRGAWMKTFGTLPMSLLRNDGTGTFTDVTEAAGLLCFYPGQVAEWADYDNDGWVDLFVGHETTPKNPSPCFLFHNNRDGTFTDVLDAAGLRPLGFVKGAAWGDYDGDGWIDLWVSRRNETSSLYRNVAAAGGGRRFDDVSEAAGIRGAYKSFASWFFDFDNDGDLDLFTATYGKNTGARNEDPLKEPVTEIGPVLLKSGEDMGIAWTRLYRNEGDGTFTDVARAMGLTNVVLVMGANFGDLDGDGWLDLYLGTGNPSFRALIPNKAFRNDQGRRFQDVTSATGLGHLQKGHAIAFADIDGDGDEDVYADMGGFYTSDTFANALYENPGNANHWLTLRLHGTQTNRRAIGVRFKVALATPSGPRTLHRMVGCASSFGASSVQQEIGLGDATGVTSVTIEWPVSRTTQVFAGLPLDRVVDLTEGDPKPKIAERKPFRFKTEDANGADRKGS